MGTHGVSGKLVIQHSLGEKTSLENTEAIFIEESPNSFLPWFIKSAKEKSDNEIFIELEGITTKEAARPLLKKEIWLEEHDFKRHVSASSPISLLGFHIYEKSKDLGEILEVVEQPHQTLCKIMLDTNEAWIPIHQDSLISIDKKKKIVSVKLPDGLLDVYRT